MGKKKETKRKRVKWKIKKGDTVIVMRGKYGNSKDNRLVGRVIKVFPDTGYILVEGVVNVKHVKPSEQFPQGGIIKVERPIHISNVMLIDPETGEPTRVGRKRNEEGKLVRYAKKSGKIID